LCVGTERAAGPLVVGAIHKPDNSEPDNGAA